MAKKSRNVLIVYEDNSAALEKLAKAVKKAANIGDYVVTMRCASETVIPEVLASDIFFFGIDTSDAQSYAELKRLFKGICLAGRHGAYFTSTTILVANSLKSSFEDAELSDSGPIAHSLEGAELSSWVAAQLA